MSRLYAVLLVSVLCLNTGCVSVELPNLISDTVKAGKEVVGSVKGGKAETSKTVKPALVNGIVFSNTVIGGADATSELLTQQCLQEIEKQAKDKLGKAQLAYKVLSNDAATNTDKLVANCSIEVI